MEKDHQLDAPDNDSLQGIEQISDHSELGSIYPHSHDLWEGTNLLSQEAREKKRDAEQLRISTSVRRWFAAIGLFITIPFIIFAVLISAAATFLDVKNLGLLLIPIFFVAAFASYASYRSVKYVYNIFYSHAIRAAPFVITLLVFIALSVYGLLLVTQPFHTGQIMIDVLIISVAAIVASIIYSGILLFFWATPKFSSRAKIAAIITMFSVIVLLNALAILYMS